MALILTLSIAEERPLEEHWSCHYATRKVKWVLIKTMNYA